MSQEQYAQNPTRKGGLDKSQLRDLSQLRPWIFLGFALIDWAVIGVVMATYLHFKGTVTFLLASISTPNTPSQFFISEET